MAAKEEALIKARLFFDQFPWDKVQHAYGQATDSPDYLYVLIDQDKNNEDITEDIVNDYLYARPWHQWDVYSSTPYAIQCVLYIIENVDVSHLKTIDRPLIYSFFHFIEICTHGAKTDETLREEITKGLSTYQRFQNHPNSYVKESVGKLIKFCKENK